MVADIFYPILTLKITVLACFIQKKNRGPRPQQSITLDPLVVLQLSPYPQLQKKNDAPIFFLDYPLHCHLEVAPALRLFDPIHKKGP